MRGSSAWQRAENETEEEEEEGEGRDKVNAARLICRMQSRRMQSRKTYLRGTRCATGTAQCCTDSPIRTVGICNGHSNPASAAPLFCFCAHLLAD